MLNIMLIRDTYISFPYFTIPWLKVSCIRHSVALITKGETPSDTIEPITLPDGIRFFSRIRSTDLFPAKNAATHRALTAWEITVAMAAPSTPMSNTKIKTGSSTIFKAAPMQVVIMLVLAKPWLVMKLFRPRVVITKTVPVR